MFISFIARPMRFAATQPQMLRVTLSSVELRMGFESIEDIEF